MTDTNAAEKVNEALRRLRNYVAMSLREKLVAPMVLDLRDVLESYTELAAECERLRKERDHERLFAQTVLASLEWTGDGYSWTGGQFDYRMSPSEAASLTVNEIERLRKELAALTVRDVDCRQDEGGAWGFVVSVDY